MATPPLPLLPFGHPLPVRRGAERIIFSPPPCFGEERLLCFQTFAQKFPQLGFEFLRAIDGKIRFYFPRRAFAIGDDERHRGFTAMFVEDQFELRKNRGRGVLGNFDFEQFDCSLRSLFLYRNWFRFRTSVVISPYRSCPVRREGITQALHFFHQELGFAVFLGNTPVDEYPLVVFPPRAVFVVRG